MIHGLLLETFLIKVTQNKKYITIGHNNNKQDSLKATSVCST